MRTYFTSLAAAAALVVFASTHGTATASPISSGVTGASVTQLPLVNADYYGRRGGWSFGLGFGGPGWYGYGYAPRPRYGYGYVDPGYGYAYRGYPTYPRYYAPGYGNRRYYPYRKYRDPAYPFGYGDS